MNREDIIRMALAAGIYHEYDSEGHWDGLTNETLIGSDWLISKEHKLNRIVEILTPFAELVASAERERIKQANAPEIERVNAYIKELEDAVKAEREACARVCDEYAQNSSNPMNFAENCAKSIRARGQA